MSLRESTVDGVTWRFNEKDKAWERVSGLMNIKAPIYYFHEDGTIAEVYEEKIEMVAYAYEPIAVARK